MAIFPRPVSPKSAASDFWSYFIENRPHKWPLLGVAAALTFCIMWLFQADSQVNTTPRQNQIIYVQNWAPDRSDADIIRDQIKELAAREKAIESKQKDMQKVADLFGVEWRKEEARNTAERKEAIKQINAQLEAKIGRAHV